MKNFINPEELDQLDEVILIDVRQDLQDPEYGPKAYAREHLHNAFYLNLEKDLSGEVTAHTGNHPLPSAGRLAGKLENMGATNDSFFVVYDEGSNFTAGRAWFVLKYFGLEKVYVLNGGYQEAVRAGLKTSDEVPEAQKSYIELTPNSEMVASYEEIVKYADDPQEGTVLVDSRSGERFRGEEEPLYDIAGHIPNAVNYFYEENYDDDGRLLADEVLEERFADLKDKRNIIVSCGSGVTACANYIVMDEIGLDPRLFVGSYSLWLKKGNRVE